MIPLRAYETGMVLVESKDEQSFLMAESDKALADKVVGDRGAAIQTQKAMYEYLVQDLRIDITEFLRMNPERMEYFSRMYRSRKLKLLSDLIRRRRRNFKEMPNA